MAERMEIELRIRTMLGNGRLGPQRNECAEERQGDSTRKEQRMHFNPRWDKLPVHGLRLNCSFRTS